MKGQLALVLAFLAIAAVTAEVSKDVKADTGLLKLNSTKSDRSKNLLSILPTSLLPLCKRWEWVERPAETLPEGCNFVYGGGLKRLLYVGRVRVGKDIIPAAIHHYGKAGTETAHYIQNNEVNTETTVEWLCGKNNLAWLRVDNLSTKTILRSGAVPIGYNSKTRKLTFGCLVHSFFSDGYPASLGTVVNGHCVFEVNGVVVSSETFDFWHTIELLVAVN